MKERDGEITRAGSIAHFIAHGNDVYGYGAVYMRLKGLVPPTTERGMVGRVRPCRRQTCCRPEEWMRGGSRRPRLLLRRGAGERAPVIGRQKRHVAVPPHDLR